MMTSRLLLLLTLCAPALPLTAQELAPPIIELRIATVAPAPGHRPVRLGDSTFHVSETVLIADADIQRADTSWVDGRLYLPLRLTAVAAARLGEATANRVGDRLAVYFNGELSAAVPIVSPIDARRMRLEALALPAAEGLAAQVVTRWPPRRRGG